MFRILGRLGDTTKSNASARVLQLSFLYVPGEGNEQSCQSVHGKFPEAELGPMAGHGVRVHAVIRS